MAEGEDLFRFDHQDAYLDMVSRREINEVFAEHPVDFNEEGLRQANKYIPLSRSDCVVDVGTSSGVFALEAAEATGTTAYLIGVEPDAGVADFMPDNRDTSRFTWLAGVGEDIPLPDSTAKVVTAHNVLFRAKDKIRMLSEMRRVAEPGGLVIVSTNARRHAYERHNFEQAVARILGLQTGLEVKPPSIPAEGCYLDDLPDILKRAGGLEILESVYQNCAALITRDRVEAYLWPLELAVNRTDLPRDRELRKEWRRVVHDVIEPKVQRVIDTGEYVADVGNGPESYFPDTVERGMIIARNIKA